MFFSWKRKKYSYDGDKLSLVCFFISTVSNAALQATPLSNKGDKYIEKIKTKYYQSMCSKYGKKGGEILKKYSILRAKAQGKKYY